MPRSHTTDSDKALKKTQNTDSKRSKTARPHPFPSTARLPIGLLSIKKKGSPYSITERRVPELIPVLGSKPAGDVSHKPGGRLPLLSARSAVTPATIKRAATNFAAW